MRFDKYDIGELSAMDSLLCHILEKEYRTTRSYLEELRADLSEDINNYWHEWEEYERSKK